MKVYIVAGEPSGDLLGAGLMKALRRIDPGVEFFGVGGAEMTACGLDSLFDIDEISVMGFFEVVPRLPLVLKRISQTAKDIFDRRPDVVVTIDSWGFVSALLGRLRRQKFSRPVVHYVAPQVWAWKKGRAPKVAKLLDRLMTLMPDEGRYFEPYGLKCDFVGHPVVERVQPIRRSEALLRKDLGTDPELPVICMLPGSRRSEIKRLLPVFRASIVGMRRKVGRFALVVPTVPGVESYVRREVANWPLAVSVVTGAENRYKAFKLSKVAIAASGTVSLELAASGTPHLIAYRFNSLTNVLARALVKIPYANLINLIAGRMVIPEYVLELCRPDLICSCAVELFQSKTLAKEQVRQAQEVLQTLRLPDILPSDRAAQIVVEEALKP